LYGGVARALDRDLRLFDFPSGAALAAELGDETVATVHRRILVPRVVVLQVYARVPVGRVRFSRHNIFSRDEHTCQYCGRALPRKQLNLDHVVPRSQGGKTNWENVVASCIACNVKKGGRTPRQAGMALRRTPQRPRWVDVVRPPSMRARYREWLPFIDPVNASYWNSELESDD
ncbi:MAG: HNH endonuclease, partial [Myxococcota bacterium]